MAQPCRHAHWLRKTGKRHASERTRTSCLTKHTRPPGNHAAQVRSGRPAFWPRHMCPVLRERTGRKRQRITACSPERAAASKSASRRTGGRDAAARFARSTLQRRCNATLSCDPPALSPRKGKKPRRDTAGGGAFGPREPKASPPASLVTGRPAWTPTAEAKVVSQRAAQGGRGIQIKKDTHLASPRHPHTHTSHITHPHT